MNHREEREPARVEAHMKTLALLLLGLTGMTACLSAKTSAPVATRSAENRAFSVIPLQHAAAAEIARTLAQLWPDARVLPDERTNSVVVTCANEAQLRECIAKLDVQVQSAK